MWLYRVNEVLIPLWRLLWRVRIVGAETFPRTGPVILAANHASFLDPWFLGAFAPRGPIRFLITDRWYERSRVWQAAFRGWGTIPTVSGRPGVTIDRVVEALGEGAIVGIFPEGRISETGAMSRARDGIGFMAARSGAAVVPCGIRGSFRALPKHRRVPRISRIEIHFGEPIRFEGSPVDAVDRTAAQSFARGVVARIAGLAGVDSPYDADREATA